MKRLLITAVLVLLAAGASAQLRVSDVLLTDDGTLFTIETVRAQQYAAESGDALAASGTILRLRIRQGESIETMAVPASLLGGNHLEPSLAWDDADRRLYVFWQSIPGFGASELLFASYKDGAWSDALTFDEGIWRIRFNLKVAITHRAESRTEEGSISSKPMLIAHAIWWEQLGPRESARYAMLELEHGEVRRVHVRELTDFATTRTSAPYPLPEDYDRNVFRTPFLFESPESDSVDVLFADWYTNRNHLVKIRPVEDEHNGVLHIPIGVSLGEFAPTPIRVRDTSAGLVAMRPSSDTGTIVVYSHSDDSVDYVVLRSGEWTSSSFLKVDDATPFDTALEGLRRLAARR